MDFLSIFDTTTAIIGKSRPFVLYHKPTSRCDCQCIFCDSWQHQSSKEDSLPTPQIIALLDNARAAGMTTYTLWGGEPLLVEDLPQLLLHAKRIGMRTVICTSGFHLDTRAREIASGVDVLLLSIEATGSRQDELRRKKGLFKNVVKGLNTYKKHTHGKIILWSNVGLHNRKLIRNIAEFADEQNIYVEFFPVALFSGYNEDLILDMDERREVFSMILNLKKEGLPVYNTKYGLNLMRSSRPFKCNTARISIFVCPDGKMYPCDPYLVSKKISYGDINDVDIKKIPDTDAYKKAVVQLARCKKCLLPCVSHTADSLFIQTIRRLINRF